MNNSDHSPSIELLSILCSRAWNRVGNLLPVDHAKRWRVNRRVQPHGTRHTVLLWRIWDSRCTSMGMDKSYFCWCLNHDPEHYYNRESHWQFHLYANTIRLYRHAEILRALLPTKLRKACPAGFSYLSDDHSCQLVWNFSFQQSLEELPEYITPMITRALIASAPVFDEVFSVLASPGGASLQRPREKSLAPVANPKVSSFGGKLSRSIRPSLRLEILKRHGQKCWICGKPLSPEEDIHIDHTVPWSKGGLTESDNLRPAHASCNLRKGGGNP